MNRLEASSILFCAGVRLLNPKKWTQNHFAKYKTIDEYGDGQEPYAFCALGSVGMCESGNPSRASDELDFALLRTIRHLPVPERVKIGEDGLWDSVPQFNDCRGRNNFQVAGALILASAETLIRGV